MLGGITQLVAVTDTVNVLVYGHQVSCHFYKSIIYVAQFKQPHLIIVLKECF